MNPYDDPEVQFSFPFERIPFGPALSDWTVMTLDEFENGGRLMLPIKVPILSGTQATYNLEMVKAENSPHLFFQRKITMRQ